MIGYVDSALPHLVKAGFRFDFQIAYPDEKEHYLEQGIKAFPFFQMGDVRIVSCEKIIAFMQNALKKDQVKQANRTSNDDVHEFMLESLGNPKLDSRGNVVDVDGDEDIDGDGMGDFRNRMSSEMERRGISSAAKPVVSASGGISMKSPPPDRASRTARRSGKKPPASKRRRAVKPVRRQAARQDNVETKTSDIMSMLGSSGGDQKRDDDLMAAFFANQETSM